MERVYSFRPGIGMRKSFFKRVNLILILINIVFFIAFSIIIYSNPNFLDFVAIKPANIFQGKYIWTFLTSMFMHGGFFHIFANMISLLFIGSLIERLLGSKRYLLFYLASGLFAGLVFVLLSWVMFQFGLPGDFNTYAVGASGALFGLIGLLMILTPNLRVFVMFIPIPIKLKYAAPGLLIVLWLVSILGNVPIGNVAHLGGFILGLIYGFYLKKKYKRKTAQINRMFS